MFQKRKKKKPRRTKQSENRQERKKEFRIMILNMIKELRRRMDEQSKKSGIFNKELENIKNHQTEVKNTETEIKNTLEEINSTLNDTEKQISEMADSNGNY